MRWLVAIMFFVGTANAQPLASSPGPLASAHAHLDMTQNCSTCHRNNTPMVTDQDCLGCHASLATRGLHTKSFVVGKSCTSCHVDHKGKSFDITGWKTLPGGQQQFDHANLADYPLLSGHRVNCVRCHTTTTASGATKFVGLSTTCESCHATKSPHGKRFAAIQGGCAACHTATRWKSVTAFDHGGHTKLALTGKHREIACRSCHRGQTPQQFEDFKGQTGCKECHAHTKVHADDDHPNGRYTTQQCTQCHLVGSHPPRPGPNIVTIYHGPNSTFPLVKAHKSVPCADCHTGVNAKGKTVFEPISPECGPKCHVDVAHQGALGAQCTKCHVSGTWDALKFTHTSYPLEGEHVGATCNACHADKKFRGTPRKCGDAACHGDDDAHQGALGKTCERCHLANGDNRFNHTTMSKFKLDGKHLAVTCDGCHPPGGVNSQYKPRPMACGGCHPEPRAHFGEYGTWCERCHTTGSWKPR